MSYDTKMIIVYFKVLKEKVRLLKWNIWQRINRRFLKTYSLIEDHTRCDDCGRNVHDFHVPDEVWIKVYGNETGTLCYDCFCNRSDILGINFRIS
jgi:hypothetical protein